MELEHFSSTPSNLKGIHEKDLDSFSPMDLLGEINTNMFKEQNQPQKQKLNVNTLVLEDLNFDSDKQFQVETTELKNKGVTNSEHGECNKKFPSSLASLELLKNYGSRFKKLSVQNNINNIETCLDHQQKMSTEEIIRFAGARYVQYSAHWNDSFFIPMHPYGLFDLVSLSEEENGDVELAQFLLAAAERVGCQQFERANSLLLLLHSQYNSSSSSNPVQRVIFRFARALQERIDKETGRVRFEKMKILEYEEMEMFHKMDTKVSLVYHQKVPFNQVMQIVAIQTMVEHLSSETKIHLIDLEIRSGVLCTALMQALAERKDCKLELLKMTAIGLITSKAKIEETGKRLANFAESLNLKFSYKVIFVTDIVEIKESHFEIGDDEAVVVYSAYFLRTLISRPNCLEKLMCVIRNIKPSIMVVLEVEANHNSPSFVNRFIEVLFFYSTFFDCVETCMKDDLECMMITEMVLSAGIRNIVANEGRERTVRNVKIDVWRRFFARYRMLETGFSDSSLYQAEMVASEFDFGKFCSINKNGKSLIVGWKGTPMHSISAWRFLG